jgi:hypothetical protein
MNIISELQEQLANAEDSLAIAESKERTAGYSDPVLSLESRDAAGYVRGLQQALDLLMSEFEK